MNKKIIRKSISGNKAVSFITVLFVTVAAMLISLAAVLTVNLSGAIEKLMLDAKTPHFMQMHTGELQKSKLEEFADEASNVAAFQILEFLNVDNSKIEIGGTSLAASVQDNGFSTQSGQFDFLLDLDNEPVHPKDGELYVPVCYFKDGTAKTGDSARIGGRTFVVAGFVRDSQMNSTLASSKRFVVSEEDYQLIKPSGNVEYLIEFCLHDLSGLGAFETAYSEARLPANGPALTWPLFQMISAVSDGIMIAVIVLIGILVIFIALLCVRFTLLAKIEEDYREIGVMKAVGMRMKDIRRIYLVIYAAIAAAGSLLGFVCSLLLQKPMQESIRLNLGNSGNNALALILGAAGAALVFLMILFYVNCSLRRFRKISAVQAIRFGADAENIRSRGTIRLSRNRLFSSNFCLAVKDVLSRKRLYSTMLVVVVLASFIIIVPQNLYHTISGEDFVTYLGVGECDLRMDIQQTGQIDEKTARIGNYMAGDAQIEDYAVFSTKLFQIRLTDGTIENIKVELGDHQVFPLQYAEGRMPLKDNEIALSVMNAEGLGKSVGGQITLLTVDGERKLTVCGTYSDITNGGKTAKAVFDATSTETAWSVVCANLTDQQQIGSESRKYGDLFPYAKVSSIDEYVTQTFGQTLQSVHAASVIAILVAAAVTLMVTVLFMRLLTAKDRHSIAVMRAVGFTSSDIGRQYAWRAVSILTVGIIAGTVLAGTLGEKVSGMALSSFGAETFHFTVNLQATYLFSPLILIISALAATIWGTFRAGDVHIYQSIKE